MVLGEAFSVDGEVYLPADTLNYDVVGHAALDDGEGVTLAHRTLPLPSYVEVTSLTSGTTILARVERRGPMTGDRFIALSAAAAAQIGATEGSPVRVRRVNPPERDRAELRAGRQAAERMETPKSLVEVLRRKLPATGTVSLRAPVSPQPTLAASATVPGSKTAPAVIAPRASAANPAAPLADSSPAPKPVAVASAGPAPVSKPPAPTAEVFIVQAAAFASKANAERVAEALGGFISPSGKYYRVRTGPFSSRGQADAALAKVRAAGYSDARVYSPG